MFLSKQFPFFPSKILKFGIEFLRLCRQCVSAGVSAWPLVSIWASNCLFFLAFFFFLTFLYHINCKKRITKQIVTGGKPTAKNKMVKSFTCFVSFLLFGFLHEKKIQYGGRGVVLQTQRVSSSFKNPILSNQFYSNKIDIFLEETKIKFWGNKKEKNFVKRLSSDFFFHVLFFFFLKNNEIFRCFIFWRRVWNWADASEEHPVSRGWTSWGGKMYNYVIFSSFNVPKQNRISKGWNYV